MLQYILPTEGMGWGLPLLFQAAQSLVEPLETQAYETIASAPVPGAAGAWCGYSIRSFISYYQRHALCICNTPCFSPRCTSPHVHPIIVRHLFQYFSLFSLRSLVEFLSQLVDRAQYT